MNPVDKAIWKKFNIKPGDTLPYRGWHNDTTRTTLAQLFLELGFTKGAEIGVAQGLYSRILCTTIPRLSLRCVDPYQPYEGCSQALCDRRRAGAVTRLTEYGVTFMQQPSMDAVRQVELESLDFVYIDGAHDFDNVMQDIIEWAKRVRPGGIVSGHDYYKFYRSGVIRAVDAYTLAHDIEMWYITHEVEASWFWVK